MTVKFKTGDVKTLAESVQEAAGLLGQLILSNSGAVNELADLMDAKVVPSNEVQNFISQTIPDYPGGTERAFFQKLLAIHLEASSQPWETVLADLTEACFQQLLERKYKSVTNIDIARVVSIRVEIEGKSADTGDKNFDVVAWNKPVGQGEALEVKKQIRSLNSQPASKKIKAIIKFRQDLIACTGRTSFIGLASLRDQSKHSAIEIIKALIGLDESQGLNLDFLVRGEFASWMRTSYVGVDLNSSA